VLLTPLLAIFKKYKDDYQFELFLIAINTLHLFEAVIDKKDDVYHVLQFCTSALLKLLL